MQTGKTETYEQKKRRIFGRVKFLPKYLETLCHLFKMEITSERLLSIVDTDETLLYFCSCSWDYICKETILFEEKNKLKEIVYSFVQDANASYFVWIDGSSDCGLCMIPNLSVFNWSFDFDIDSNGIISFMRKDGEEEIVLDYYEEDNQYLLDIKLKKKM